MLGKIGSSRLKAISPLIRVMDPFSMRTAGRLFNQRDELVPDSCAFSVVTDRAADLANK